MSTDSQSGNDPQESAFPSFPVVALLRGLAGAAVGAVLGYFGFDFLHSQGFYSAILPGALIGLGFGLAARRRLNLFGIICAVIALPVSLWTEWKVMPFVDDPSFSFFLQHIVEKPVSVIMHLLGVLGAFWFGRGR